MIEKRDSGGIITLKKSGRGRGRFGKTGIPPKRYVFLAAERTQKDGHLKELMRKLRKRTRKGELYQQHC